MPHAYPAGLLNLLLALSGLLCSGATAQDTLYVNGVCGDDAWSGLSPVCGAPDGPKRTIRAAVAATGPGDTVLVAPGVYTGTGNHNVQGPKHALTLRAEAGPFETVVDGEGSSVQFLGINSRNGTAMVVQGFTMTNMSGWAPIMADHEGDLTVIDCRFIDNQAAATGGIWWGGGAYPATVRVVNCVFANNSGTYTGAVMVQYGPVLDVVNCTFVDNVGNAAQALWSPRLHLSNSICRGESPQIAASRTPSPVSYCNIEGPWEGNLEDAGGNIDADPLFADPGADDYRLLAGSPCIDAADNTKVPDWLTTDIGGVPRFADDPATKDTGVGPPPVVDMGAHEFQPDGCYPDFTGDGSLDLFDFLAFVNAFNAGDPAADCHGDNAWTLFDFLCFTNAFNAGC